MPITPQHFFKPLNQAEFGQLSYEVFADVISIRRDLGRFFDEKHYKKALASIRPDVLLEAPIPVSHGSFKKCYFLDVVLCLGGVFEFKVIEAFNSRHKAQLLHYLMLAELWHGMLINVRPEKMQRDFVNHHLRHGDRQQFRLVTSQLQRGLPGSEQFVQILTDLLHDCGTSLDLSLYEEGITHFCGGESALIRPAMVHFNGQPLGPQKLRFITEKTAFKLTAFDRELSQKRFATHLQQLVNHADIESMIWANVCRNEVTIQSLIPER